MPCTWGALALAVLAPGNVVSNLVFDLLGLGSPLFLLLVPVTAAPTVPVPFVVRRGPLANVLALGLEELVQAQLLPSLTVTRPLVRRWTVEHLHGLHQGLAGGRWWRQPHFLGVQRPVVAVIKPDEGHNEACGQLVVRHGGHQALQGLRGQLRWHVPLRVHGDKPRGRMARVK